MQQTGCCSGHWAQHTGKSAGRVQVPAVGAWASLKELVLDDCRGLKQVTLGLPALRSISLQCCPALRSVRSTWLAPWLFLLVHRDACPWP